MTDPLLHLLVGPNGAGKSTLYDKVLGPATHLPFINADLIAAELYPDSEQDMSYEAAQVASTRRSQHIEKGTSFIAETVFSHPSKLELISEAQSRGYIVTLHVVIIPKALALQRVPLRVKDGGHSVPADKIASRYDRLWPLVARATRMVPSAVMYDNSTAKSALREVAHFAQGRTLYDPDWPSWAPAELVALTA